MCYSSLVYEPYSDFLRFYYKQSPKGHFMLIMARFLDIIFYTDKRFYNFVRLYKQ